MLSLKPTIDNLQRNVARLRTRRNLLFAPIFAAIYTLGWWVRFEGESLPMPWDQMLGSLCPVVLVKLSIFLGLFGSHFWVGYLTFHDLGALVRASKISSVCLLTGD